jgi:hypothetical protein
MKIPSLCLTAALIIGSVNDLTRKALTQALLGFFLGVSTVPASAQDRLPYDRPTPVSGIEVVCTGIGSSVRADPRWETYPLKVEVAGADGQFLGNVSVAIEQDDQTLVRVSCGGPWVLARLGPGAYTITASFEEQSTSSTVNVPLEGQGRLILRFPESGGSVTP